MRWLIEFVGIVFDDKTRKPIRPKRRKDDVSIQSFVAKGSGLDLQVTLDPANPSREARILADVWKGFTQSSVHSTFRTNHPPEDPPALSFCARSEEHTSELQSFRHLVRRLLLEKKTLDHYSPVHLTAAPSVTGTNSAHYHT